MRTINNKVLLGILCMFLSLASCTSHYTNITKVRYGNDHENIISYTLSMRGDKFYLTKKIHPSFGSSYEGTLIKSEINEFELKSFNSPDSINYPVTYIRDNNIDNKFILEIPYYLPFKKLLVDGNIYLDTIIKAKANLPKYMKLELKSKPHQIQIFSYTFNDEIFEKYTVEYKSKKYFVPDTCNHMIIDEILLKQYPIGVSNLKFNKQTMILYADTNKIQFFKFRGKLNKFERKINSRHLRHSINP